MFLLLSRVQFVCTMLPPDGAKVKFSNATYSGFNILVLSLFAFRIFAVFSTMWSSFKC